MTGYGLRYSGGFYDSDGNTITVEIHQKGYASLAESITLKADNPIVISKPQGDLLTHIFGTGCKINIVNNGSFLRYSELFGTPEREHYVLIKKTVGAVVIKLFEGFVLPQMYEQSLQTNASITIPANDQLSTLKNKKSTILTGDDNFIKLIDLVKEIVWSTDIHNPIYIKSGLYNTFYTAAFSTSITPFDETYIDKNIFLEEPDVPKDNYYVLETILKTFGSRLYYLNGKWVIDRVKNHTDIDNYKVYNYAGTTSVVKATHSIIELSDHYLINGSGNMSYEAGVKDYELTLNTDLFDNLINPSFKGVKEANNITYYAVPTSGVDDVVGGFAYTNRYEWVHNIDSSLGDNIISINDKFKDTNITDYGINWFVKRGNINQVFPAFAAVTTSFLIDYVEGDTQKDVTLRVNYKYSMLNVGYFETTNRNYKARFTLRIKDSLGAWWTLYEDGAGVVYLNNAVTTLSRLYFETTTTGDDIKNSDNPSIFVVNKDIKIGVIMDEIKTKISPSNEFKFIQFYIDFYLLQEEVSTNSWIPVQTKIGDLNVYSRVDLEDNVIEATIDDNYNSDDRTLELDLYDAISVSIQNSMYFLDGESYIPTGYYKWSEEGYAHTRKIQMIYLTDLIQNFNQNRYKLSTSVKLNGVNQIDLNNLFTYTHITKDNIPVEMLPMGYDYNVKQNTYNLHLQEWTDDDGYYWEEDLGIDPKTLTVAPMDIEIPSWGSLNTINVTSNTDWVVETLSDWIILNKEDGFGNDSFNFTVYSLDNPADGRIGTITVSTIGGTIVRTIDVAQSSTFDTDYSEN